MYTIEIYTDNMSGKKTLAKQIAAVIDEVMIGLRFQRMSFSPIPNVDRDITRYVGRYRAVVSRGITDGTDTEYYIYRR